MLFSRDNLQKKQTPNPGSDPYWKRNPFNTYTEFIVDYILHSIAFFGRLLFFDWLKLTCKFVKRRGALPWLRRLQSLGERRKGGRIKYLQMWCNNPTHFFVVVVVVVFQLTSKPFLFANSSWQRSGFSL